MSVLKQFWNHPLVQRVAYFFPIQLFLLHIKQNHLLLLFWTVLLGFITSSMGETYGVPYLFLDPEYMGRVDFWSFLLLGFSVGGFIMAYHIASYTLNASKFPFLATLARPFFKYSFNNSIIPTLFVGVYIYCIVKFQYRNELFVLENNLKAGEQLIWYIIGFVGGILLFMVPGYLYFIALSRNIYKVFRLEETEGITNSKGKTTVRRLLKKNLEWRNVAVNPENEHHWKVTTYLAHPLKVGLTRDTEHYESEMIQTVFQQNHIIAVVFEIVVLVSFLMVGAYRETPELSIPSGAVIFLACTVVLMAASAVHTALRGWSAVFVILLMVLVQSLVSRDILHYKSEVYGMNYDTTRATYHLDSLKNFDQNFKLYDQDVRHHFSILNKWKAKNSVRKSDKPKLVLICVTGGGSRSAMWVFKAMQVADSLSQGRIMRQAHLITGASGGMLGMGYLRELYLRSQTDTSVHLYSEAYTDKMGADLLNPIAVSIGVNDWFIRFQQFRDGNYIYTKDRGYALERQLIINTDSVFDKRLGDYTLPEAEAKIPMMVFTPSIINDGRTLFIASQPVSHLTFNHPNILKGQSLQSGVEFSRMFEGQDADNTWFTSVMRMNASFPYICPSVTLPSEPEIEVMDAGFRDTYGISMAMKHLYAMRSWVEENTSGVVIIQIRDSEKIETVSSNPPRSVLNMLMNPLGHIYDNLFLMQDYTNDDLIVNAQEWLDTDLEVVDLELMRSTENMISLSWHLTAKEKYLIKRSAYHPKNKAAMERIVQLLNTKD